MKADTKPTIIDNTILETKDQKTIKMPQWIKQVEAEAKRADTKKWLLFFKTNGKGYVCMDLNYFETIIKK